jgi:hypothetical protein
MGDPPYNVCSTQCLSTLSAVRAACPRKKNSAAKNYEFEKKKTAYFARGGRASAIKFATGFAVAELPLKSFARGSKYGASAILDLGAEFLALPAAFIRGCR